MKSRIAIVGVMSLTLLVSSPATGKNRPTVDADNGDTCFADPGTDKNCNTGGSGAICYCCYDDGCWICGTNPLPGNECVWDPKYRALSPSLSIGLMSTEDPHDATQDALITLLQKKKVVTKKDLVDELMTARETRARAALESGNLKESVATQKRINHYFHDEVVPKLKTCWDRVRGNGTIEIEYLYEEDARRGWAFKSLKRGRSTLPEGQDEVALACMRDAVAATSFPKEGSSAGASYSIKWDWPVPLPPDASQQAEAMFRAAGGSGSGGCDGRGAAPRCVVCAGKSGCELVCVGFDSCTISAPSPDPSVLRMCQQGRACASGGAFGVVGGAVIY